MLGLDQLRNHLYEIKDKHISLTNLNYLKTDEINKIKEHEEPLEQLLKDANMLISNLKRKEFQFMEEAEGAAKMTREY